MGSGPARTHPARADQPAVALPAPALPAPTLPAPSLPAPALPAVALTPATAETMSLQVRDGWDHLAPDGLQRAHPPDVGYRADRRLESQFGKLAELINDLAGLLPLFANVEDEITGLLDLLVVTFFFYGNGDHRDLHSFPTRRSSD